MNFDANPYDSPEPESAPAPELPRLFLREPGWRVGLKVGSERTFCYAIAPGQDFYHRLMDGELFLYRGDERLCLPCAARRGLLAFEPRPLRPPAAGEDLDAEATSEYEVRGA